MKRSVIVKAIKEVIEELSSTSGVAGYQTPFAFSKGNKKNRATKQAEKLGYKTVKTKKRPHNTKMFDYLDENVN
jgi:hypothetical protein|tara:strand:- start:269 stop:490 length:222 start_codon:yes stop_codon:yes gene_type:complete